jgi:hypothetical protein
MNVDCVEWCHAKKGPIERTQFKVVGATCEVQKITLEYMEEITLQHWKRRMFTRKAKLNHT